MSESSSLAAASERERALEATAALWRRRGYQGLNVEAICERAGIDPESFEAMFASVEAAAAAVVEVPLVSVVEIVGQLYSPDRSEAESYALAIARILNFMAANPDFAYVAYIAGRQMAPPEVHRRYETGRRFLVVMLERLWGNSGLGEQSVHAGLGGLGGAEALVRREVAAGTLERLPALAPQCVFAAMVPFLGQREALRLARMVAVELPSWEAPPAGRTTTRRRAASQPRRRWGSGS